MYISLLILTLLSPLSPSFASPLLVIFLPLSPSFFPCFFFLRASIFSLVLYSEWLGGKDSAKAHEMLHTQYHEVEKFISALTIKW